MTLKKILTAAAFTAAFIILYYEAVLHIVSKWSIAESSHGPLILAVSLYLVWINRKKLAALRSEPQPWPGGILTALGCFMLLAGNLLGITSLQELSLIPVILGAIWMLWGTAAVKVFLLPVGYLVFMTGLMEGLLNTAFGFQLQIITAWSAAKALALYGMPVFLSETIVELPHISLEVIRECSGINHLIALLALAVPLAFLTQKSAAAKAVLILAALLIGIFANILRVTLIGLHTFYYPEAEVHGFNETLRVTFVFFFGMVLLVLFSMVLKKWDAMGPKNGRGVVQGPSADEATTSVPAKIDAPQPPVHKKATPWFAALTLLAVTIALIHLYTPQAIYLKQPLKTFPDRIAGYTFTETIKADSRIRPLPADDELMRLYQNSSGNAVKLYIGYYALQGKDHRAIDYRRSWLHTEAVEWQVPQGTGTVAINQTRIRSGPFADGAYFWYAIDDRIVTSRNVGTLITLWNTFVKRKNNAAVIVIQTNGHHSDIDSFISEVLSLTKNHLTDAI